MDDSVQIKTFQSFDYAVHDAPELRLVKEPFFRICSRGFASLLKLLFKGFDGTFDQEVNFINFRAGKTLVLLFYGNNLRKVNTLYFISFFQKPAY
jgi:hypothetical protein